MIRTHWLNKSLGICERREKVLEVEVGGGCEGKGGREGIGGGFSYDNLDNKLQ